MSTMSDINPLGNEWKERGLVLHEYQKEGVEKMDSWYQAGHGGINGDEMGLGKTCQAIVLMLRLKCDGRGPFLVLCPFSVTDHWVSEVRRFSCQTLEQIGYYGSKEDRANILENISKLKKNMVFIVPYHILRKDADSLDKFQQKCGTFFNVVILDEAQSVKNLESEISKKLRPYLNKAWFLLMTGTPIQNNLEELYSLLVFADPKKFKYDTRSKMNFVEKYKINTNIPRLREILSNYLIRRTKDVACKELPSCDQVVIYHNITEIQKRLYLDIIAKDHDSMVAHTGSTNSLISVHMQLRKCVSHPYLFKGVEPEPFYEGEHIVEASGKFQVLDRLLRYLKEKGHRCLIFSQFALVMDLVQDFMNLRGYNYEYIDGNVRAEERFSAINNFQKGVEEKKKKGRLLQKDDDFPWCFLLTTKSGGVGLNLTAADTVIFLDADWNPQNDIQAMARCHRIGQYKPVRVIRLIGRYTIEQHMHARIRDKLRFTEQVMGSEVTKLKAFDLLAMVKENLGMLKEQTNQKYELTDEDLESVIGETRNGEWLALKDEKENSLPAALRLDPDEVDKRDTDYDDYLVFEGRHYRVSKKDEVAFKELQWLNYGGKGRRRKRYEVRSDEDDGEADVRDNMKLLDIAKAEKRKKAAEEKRDSLWMANGYVSANLPLPGGEDQESADGEAVEEATRLHYVRGDVTRPQREEDDQSKCQLILHCVDNSGTFGDRGIFAALRTKDPSIADRYELISRMGDLKIGDAHLISEVKELRESPKEEDQPSTSSGIAEAVILFVGQNSRRRDEIRIATLERCFARIGEYARHNDVSVHMARIGYGTPLSWYTVERLIRKYISDHGVPTYIYYFAKPHRLPVQLAQQLSPRVRKKRENPSPHGPSKRAKTKGDSEVVVDDDEEMEEEEEDSDSSSASSSSSEHDWSDENDDDEDEEESYDEDEDEAEFSEEEVMEEELEDLNIKRKKQNSPTAARHRGSRRRLSERSASAASPAQSSKEIQTSESESDGYRTPEHVSPFSNLAVSLYGLDKDTANKLAEIITKNEGYAITELEELKDATHAVISAEAATDSQKFEEFREFFNPNCLFVGKSWVTDSVEHGKKIDVAFYEL